MAGGAIFLEVYQINLFETVKENVTLRQAAEEYGVDVRYNGMACCPFHADNSPSMKLYEDHFYCFGCGEHGDVIDFVGKLLSLTSKQAAETIAHDFGINYEEQQNSYFPNKNHIIKRIKQEQEKAKENRVYTILCSYFRLLRDWKREYAPSSAEESLHPLFIESLMKTEYIEALLDDLISGDKDIKSAIINGRDNEISEIEKKVRKYSNKVKVAEIAI